MPALATRASSVNEPTLAMAVIMLLVPGIIGQERINIDRSKKIKRAINESGLVFGYGLTDPITIVLDLDHLENLIK